MPRTHFTRNSITPECGRAFRPGNFSTPHIVRGAAFKAVPEAEVCSYCAAAFLRLRNQQRKAKGLPPVERYNSPTPERA